MRKKKVILSLLISGIMLLPSTVQALENSDRADSISESTMSKELSTSSISDSISSTSSNGSNAVNENSKGTEKSVEQTSSDDTAESKQSVNLNQSEEAEFGKYSTPSNRSDLAQNSRANLSRGSIPAVLASNRNTPSKSFIDISSHNGNISVNEFKIMKKYGVMGVVVKLTEATSYINPYAASQVRNAKSAGLKVSAYHYSWFQTDNQARAEADYFVKAARNVGLDSSAVMVNDIEEPSIAGRANHTANSLAFENRLKQLGFSTVRHYSSLSWFQQGLLNENTLGRKKIWVAAYPYSITNKNYYTQYDSWQWNSRLIFPEIKNKEFDISADYGNYFTNDSLLTYSSHVQSKGWLNSVTSNSVSGTVNEGK